MAETREHEDLRLSRVFVLTARALSRRPLTAALLAALTIYAPNLAFAYFGPLAPTSLYSLSNVAYFAQLNLALSISAIFSAWIAFQLHEDEPAPLRVTIARGLPLYVASFVVGFVSYIGILALIIPGLLWGLACTVVLPAVAIERLGVVKAVTRSFDLTEYRRWAILGFTIVVLLPPTMAIWLLELGLTGWRIDGPDQDSFVTLSLRPITDTVLSVLGSALTAAFYSELVRLPRVDAPLPRVQGTSGTSGADQE